MSDALAFLHWKTNRDFGEPSSLSIVIHKEIIFSDGLHRSGVRNSKQARDANPTGVESEAFYHPLRLNPQSITGRLLRTVMERDKLGES